MKWGMMGVFVGLVVLSIWLPEPVIPQKKESTTLAEHQVHDFIIRNVRLYDGEQTFEEVDVLIESQRIKLIGQSIVNNNQLREIDGIGHSLIPGLIDSHTHAWDSALQQALNFGVTTELDMFTMPEFSQQKIDLRDQLNNVSEADLFSATILATAPKGHGTEYGFDIPVISQVAQVKSFVENRIEHGADYIKAVYRASGGESENLIQNASRHPPSISFEILAELIQQAHLHQRMLVVHVEDLLSAKQAIRLGADGIIHSFLDIVADDELIDLMVKQKAFVIPTLLVESSMAGGVFGRELAANSMLMTYAEPTQINQLKAQFIDLGIEPTAYANAQQSTFKLHQAGVPILAGSDAPNPGTTHGAGLYGEMLLLEAVGLTAEEVLHSATGQVGKVFPIGQRGTLTQGSLASMLLVDGDPTKRISDLQKIVKIWKNGVIYSRKIYSHDNLMPKSIISAGLINNFDISIERSAFGAGIGMTSDKVAGGGSEVKVSQVNKQSQGNDHYAVVSGEIKPGFMFPWGGIAFIPGKSYNEGANLNKFKVFKFNAKGSAVTQEISVMVYQQGSHRPFIQKIPLSLEWQQYRLNFDKVKNIDLTQVSNISLTISGSLGEFEFSVDDFILE